MASNSTKIALGPAVFATAAGMFASQVGGRSTRDALFLAHFPVTALPVMIMATAVLALALAYVSTRVMVRWGPAIVMPAAFALSAALLLVEWGVSFVAPSAAAVLVYLHFGGLGALLISGFWSLLNERLDPRSAKRQLGQVNAAGTLGGLCGGLAARELARFIPVAAMLPVLAGIQLVCVAGMVRLRGRQEREAHSAEDAPRKARTTENAPRGGAEAPSAAGTSTAGLRGLLSMPYIRNLISLVVLLTIADVMIDLVLKARAKEVWPDEAGLLRFFAAFYTAVQLLVFLVQAFVSRFVLERVGPARTAAILPAGAAVGAVGAFVAPGLTSVAVGRGAQSVLNASLFNAGYEVLFTPVPARDKRAIKSLVDVGASRAGDLLGAAVAQGVVFLPMALHDRGDVLLALAAVLSVAAFLLAFRLQRGYVQALARGLVRRAVHLELSEATDSITRSTLLKTLQISKPVQRVHVEGGVATAGTAAGAGGRSGPIGQRTPPDSTRNELSYILTGQSQDLELPEATRARALRSRDPETVRGALGEGPITESLLPQAVALLAWDPVTQDAIAALRRVGPAAIDALVEPILDSDSDFTIRRRVPLVLGTIADPRSVQALLLSMTDRRFEVRYRSGRALAHLHSLDPTLSVPADIVFGAVRREVEVSAAAWESRGLLDRTDDEAWSPVMDELVRDRADRSLEHVFTLFALVLPRKPLRIAFRALHTGDPLLRGTALEYLETVLPPEVRKPLWPFLEPDRTRHGPAARSHGEALDELLRMNDSIAIKLEDLRK
ncbi:MAG TPA: Npt1/Npt2 family nucleotide transporter [Candidatus Omnitrophota bacterium]|nr:Npt1/Npt2 family nucleotide transporter [Candidatus Omnitrophota bacterium]